WVASSKTEVHTIYLAHGASGDARIMRPYVRALAARTLPAEAVDPPRSGRSGVKAETAAPTIIEKVPAGSTAGGHAHRGRAARLATTMVPGWLRRSERKNEPSVPVMGLPCESS